MKNFAGASALAGQEIELVIPAKINDGVTRSNIPNKATFSFKDKNDHKGEKETIPVTVTPPTEPNVSKKINGDQDNATIAAETDFTYNIKTTLPNDIDTYKSFVITDTLDENLGVVNPEPSISEEAKKFFDITVSGNTVTATMKDFAKASALANKEIELVIHAKVKKESVLPEIPNTAKITYTNKNNESKEKETEPVKVTPPPITKKVNGKDQEDLASLTSTFKYTVDSKVPTVADKFVLSDTLEEVLTFDGDATVTIDGQAVTDVTVAKKGQKLTVTFDKDQVKKYAGKAVQVAFDAKIKSGYTVDQLVAKYPNGDKAAIPNKASFVVNDNPETEKFSNPVTVTPPPPNTPEIEKKVNGADSYNLQTRLEEFTYSLDTAMPTNATEFTVTDELKSVLEFAGNKGDVEVKIDGKAANDQATISTDKNTLTVAFAEKAVKANAGKSIEVTFKAKIREGANLLDYLVPGQGIRIPNKASYDIDHNPKFHKDSNEVPVTPPSPEQPPIEKDVNDKAEATLEARDEEFTYHVKTKIPYEATAFNITDTLKDVLDFSGEKGQAEATVDGKKLSDDHIAINGQTITVTLNQEELKANADKEIKLTFKAKIRPNANLAAYVVGDKVVINNQASYNVDLPDNPGVHKDSNIVPVTPPSPEKPEIEKTVNDAKEATLANRDEIFTYKVKTKVPFDATAFSIDDTIKDVLEFADAGSATLNGEALEADRISIADQKITLTLTEDQVKNNGGKEVVLTFKAKIRQGANLSGYIEKGKTVINNQASYNAAFPNDPNFHKDSNIVPVTPPSPENPPVEKKVNNKPSATLDSRDEEFTYTIDTKVPVDATGFKITDELKDVLEFSGKKGQAEVTVDGDKDVIEDSQITVDKQVLTVTLTKDQVKKYGNKAVHVSFKAKIRKNVSLAGYIEADGVTRIPNIAKYIINDDPKTEKSTEPVPVIPPSPEEPGIKKEVNGQPEATLKERYEEFTYKVTTSVPQDATAFSVSDTLVPVLEFSGEKGQATATLDGQEIDANRINVADQTISMALTEDEVKANGGKEVTLTFKAKIREGANLSDYIEKGKTSIPNTASYTAGFPNRPEIHKDSNRVPVTPPTPEEPGIKKDVNGKEEETLANRNDEFTYHINTKVPFDATAFSINDELKDVLEFADGTGRATASLNGQALDADRISVNGQTITVNLTEDQVKNNGGKDVNLTFTAKIRQGVNLSGYIKDGKTSIPNKASYRVDFPNNPGVTKDSNEVPVTPPSPENPPIEKKVNEAESANLGARDEEFTYTIDTTVPLDVTGFAVYDTIEKVLEFSGENGQASATVDGQPLDASHITIKGQKITVKLTEDEAKALGGKAVHVSFKAKIKAGANLSDYIEKDGTTRIYNTAKYNFNNDPGTEQSSKPVPVIPPTPTEPELKKEVNGKEAETLANRDDVFTYTVKTTVPQDATAFSISDSLVPVLEFAGEDAEASLTLNGEKLGAKQIKLKDQTISAELTEEQVKANGGKEVVLNFKAKIREGANLSAYMKADKAEVPNKASYTVGFPNKPAVTKDSNVVPVTPPSPEQPPIEKDVNSKPSETIADRTEEFTYNIHTTMPQDATGFTVTDELKDVLEFAGDVQVTLGGKKADAAVAKNGQTLEVTFPEETVKANGGKKVQVTFKAKIKADADLTPYETANSYSVPNTASYLINNNPASKKETKPVTVEVPKQPGPEVTKKINRTLDHLDVDRDVPYMYNVNTQIPKDIRLYKEFTVTDTLEPVLEITGTPVAYVDGYATDAVETKVEGNTVTVTVKDFARISGYKEIQLYIPSKLKADSDLSAYENQTVPNKATIAFKDSNGKNGTKESNPVTVRPRDPEKPEEPKPNEPAKTVGPADGSNPSTAYRLKELKEGFRFDVTAKVPTDPVDESGNPIKDAQGRDVKTELNSFTVTDELEKVLKVDRVAVKIEENKVAEAIAKITAKIEKAESDLKELEGKETNGTFAKKLAEAEKKVEELTAQLAAAKEKAAAAPATPAPASDSDAGDATATPAPADNNAEVAALEASLKAAQAELEQLKADGAKAGNLATPEEQKVEQDKLNKNLEQLKESKEKLEKALEAFTTVNDKGEITDEALAKIAKVTVEGQKVTVEVTDKAVLEALKGSTFRVIIYSSIKDGADLSNPRYLNKENNETKIPNKATVTFNDKPKVTNTVNVYPPEPNTPPTTPPHTPPTTPNTPPPTTPDTPPAPKGDLPPAPTPEPEKPKNILPKTGTSATMVNEVIIGMILVLMGLLLRRKPKH